MILGRAKSDLDNDMCQVSGTGERYAGRWGLEAISDYIWRDLNITLRMHLFSYSQVVPSVWKTRNSSLPTWVLSPTVSLMKHSSSLNSSRGPPSAFPGCIRGLLSSQAFVQYISQIPLMVEPLASHLYWNTGSLTCSHVQCRPGKFNKQIKQVDKYSNPLNPHINPMR